MTHRHRILTAIKARLASITVANGYATNVGMRVQYGAVDDVPKDDELPMAIFVAGRAERLEEGARAEVQMPVAIRALTVVSPADELAALEPLLGDLEKALFGVDDQLGGEVSDVEYVGEMVIDRSEGDTVGGVGLDILVKWRKVVGAPDS